MGDDSTNLPPITDLGAFGQWLTDPFSTSQPPVSAIPASTMSHPPCVNPQITVTGEMSDMSHWDMQYGGVWPDPTFASSRLPSAPRSRTSHLTVPDSRSSSSLMIPSGLSTPAAAPTSRYLSPTDTTITSSSNTSGHTATARGTKGLTRPGSSRSPIRKSSPKPRKPAVTSALASSYPGFVESQWESGVPLDVPSAPTSARPSQIAQTRQTGPPSLSYQLSDGRSHIFDEQTRATCVTKAQTVWTARNKLKSIADKTQNTSARSFLRDMTSTFFRDTPPPEIFGVLPVTPAGAQDNEWIQAQMKKLQYDLSLLEGNGSAVRLLQHLKDHKLLDLDAEGIELSRREGGTHLTFVEERRGETQAGADDGDGLSLTTGKDDDALQHDPARQARRAFSEFDFSELDFLMGAFF